MLECKKILVNTEKTTSVKSESISIIITDEIPDESELNFIVSESVKHNCRFMIIWSKSSDEIEDKIDYLLEDKQIYGISTTSHKNESEDDVINFAKYATFVGDKFFSCFIFSEKNSIKAENLMNRISN